MIKIKFKADLYRVLEDERQLGRSVGFVPTMGALHEGHLDLVRSSKEGSDITVCSIFVNPTQFNNQDDLEKYPRTESIDIEKLEKSGCDIVFIPSVNEIYPDSSMGILSFDFGESASILEGQYRPGHFNGVGLVVSKLFNIVKPDKAYFGQKDLQQFHIIQKLVLSLSFPIELICVPTRRENDGLAMSSRNLRIDPDKRPIANLFYKALEEARAKLEGGMNLAKVKSHVNNIFESHPSLRLEYFEIIDKDSFQIISGPIIKGRTALVIAGYVDNIRLIDNVMYI